MKKGVAGFCAEVRNNRNRCGRGKGTNSDLAYANIRRGDRRGEAGTDKTGPGRGGGSSCSPRGGWNGACTGPLILRFDRHGDERRQGQRRASLEARPPSAGKRQKGYRDACGRGDLPDTAGGGGPAFRGNAHGLLRIRFY